MPTFAPGLVLNEGFYRDAVAPLLAGVPHAAGRLGWGSDVLGFDTDRSTDHGWGPHLEVFVAPDAIDETTARIDAGLPETYREWPVRFGWDAVPVKHHVYVSTLSEWSLARIGFDATRGVQSHDWLATPQQRLLEVTGGAVYHDATGELSAVRDVLAYYPNDVWHHLIACQWRRIAQEEAFVGRAAEVGDELGSMVIAARLARDLMRLWFLFHRTYAPYSKWLGSAFAQLPDSAPLSDALRDAIAARDYRSRETALVTAYEIVANKHNALGITEPVDPTVRLYYGRPFRVLMADRFTGDVTDPGSIDQWTDSTDVLSYPARFRQLRGSFLHE